MGGELSQLGTAMLWNFIREREVENESDFCI
jgi:hypothetical protein